MEAVKKWQNMSQKVGSMTEMSEEVVLQRRKCPNTPNRIFPTIGIIFMFSLCVHDCRLFKFLNSPSIVLFRRISTPSFSAAGRSIFKQPLLWRSDSFENDCHNRRTLCDRNHRASHSAHRSHRWAHQSRDPGTQCSKIACQQNYRQPRLSWVRMYHIILYVSGIMLKYWLSKSKTFPYR